VVEWRTLKSRHWRKRGEVWLLHSITSRHASSELATEIAGPVKGRIDSSTEEWDSYPFIPSLSKHGERKKKHLLRQNAFQSGLSLGDLRKVENDLIKHRFGGKSPVDFMGK